MRGIKQMRIFSLYTNSEIIKVINFCEDLMENRTSLKSGKRIFYKVSGR